MRRKHNVDRLVDALSKVKGDFTEFNRLVFGDNPHGLPPVHPGQEGYFLNTMLPKFNCLCCGNSWGKTDLIARMHVYYCIYKEGLEMPERDKAYAEYNTLNCSYTYDVSGKEFNRIVRLQHSSDVLRFMIESVDNVHHKIRFKNNSVFTSGSTERGGRLIEGDRYALLTVEEAGWERNLRNLTENVLQPRTIVPYMRDGGHLHFIGTPKPFSDIYFFSVFQKGMDENYPRHYSQRGSVYENVFLPTEELKRLEEDYADSPLKSQVLHGEFVADSDAPFKHDVVFGMFSDGLEPDMEPRKGAKYIMSWDLARKRDKTVGTLLDYSCYPLIIRANAVTIYRQTWKDVYDAVERMYKLYRPVGVIVDSTGLGDVVAERIEEMEIPVDGVVMGQAVKEKMILCLQDCLSREVKNIPYPYDDMLGSKRVRGCIKSFPDSELENQLMSYRWNDSRLETDSLMSLALGIYYLYTCGIIDYECYDKTDFLAKIISRR